MDFEKAIEFVLGAEGKYSNHPQDPGGETKFGISHTAYPDLDIKNLTLDQAKGIYRKDFWGKCRCDELPDPLRLLIFDSAVNLGASQAVKILQRLVGAKVDGMIGVETINRAATNVEIPALYLAERALLYTKLPTFPTFGRGWLKRLFILAKAA